MIKPKKLKRSNKDMIKALDELKKEPTKRINANIAESQHKELKIKAAQNGDTINDLITKWIFEYLR